jgi:DNA polymerase III epsilon subunit-like protein
MTKYAVLDTETSGLFDFKLPADAPTQPRLCAITLILTDDDIEPIETYSALIKPDGWTVSEEITAVNGLTTERCEADGVPILEALARYTDAVKAGYVVVAFNAQFDTKVMRGEFRRAGLPDLFEETPNICAMRASKGLGVEKAGEKKGGFPKLSDVYRHFFFKELDAAHTSLSDATACLEIFRKLVQIGAAPAPEVHYAKNRPGAPE